MIEILTYLIAALVGTIVIRATQVVVTVNHTSALSAPKLSNVEIDAILAEPIDVTVWRGYAVALEPYAQHLFTWLASLSPPASGSVVGSHAYTGASVACGIGRATDNWTLEQFVHFEAVNNSAWAARTQHLQGTACSTVVR